MVSLEIVVLYFFIFITYSFFGWIVEELYSLVVNDLVTNRGFLIGTYCPIYGITALLMHFFLVDLNVTWPILFIIIALGVTLIEYITSVLMEKLFRARWWDYSEKPFNINGRVCLSHTILFGILGMLFVYWLDPLTVDFAESIPSNFLVFFTTLLFIIFLIDLIISFNVVKKVKTTAEVLRKDYTDEINEKVREFLMENSYFTKRLIRAFPDFRAIIKNKRNEIENKMKNMAKKGRKDEEN